MEKKGSQYNTHCDKSYVEMIEENEGTFFREGAGSGKISLHR